MTIPHAFAPAWAPPDLLERTLVGRKALVDRLEELALDGAGGANKHQRLVVGPPGSGKTHVLRAVHHRLSSTTALRARLLIIDLLEEELGVASFADFAVRLLRAILRGYPEHAALRDDLEALYNLPPSAQEERAVSLLLESAADRDVLVLLENLASLFDRRTGLGRDGQQALRGLVQRYPRFMIFATSRILVEGTTHPDAPFYGFFRVNHLAPLLVDESREFLSIAAAPGSDRTVGLSADAKARARALHHLTGGNHRCLAVFAPCVACDRAQLGDVFLAALNQLRPYYQGRLQTLSAQQQRILQHLSLERVPCTVKSIARACLAAPNTISRQFKHLHDDGFVVKMEHGRESFYEVTDPLFRMCYEETGPQARGARVTIDLLTRLYGFQSSPREMTPLRHRCEGASTKEILSLLDEALGFLADATAPDHVGEYEEALADFLGVLFERAPPPSFVGYLVRLRQNANTERVEAALLATVFALLGEHAVLDEQRLCAVATAVREAVQSADLATRMLEVGVQHLVAQDPRALLRLTREERQAFSVALSK